MKVFLTQSFGIIRMLNALLDVPVCQPTRTTLFGSLSARINKDVAKNVALVSLNSTRVTLKLAKTFLCRLCS